MTNYYFIFFHAWFYDVIILFSSGGHFNPAVSVCVYLIGGMELMLLVPYVLSQMLGGVIAAGLAKVCVQASLSIFVSVFMTAGSIQSFTLLTMQYKHSLFFFFRLSLRMRHLEMQLEQRLMPFSPLMALALRLWQRW